MKTSGYRMHVGILGGGQLGRMIALAGYPLGIRCRILDPNAESPAAHVAEHLQGEYEDYRTLFTFASGLDVITFEFENVPVESVQWLAERLPAFPSPSALAVAQDRIAEKTFFQQRGIPTPAFASVQSKADLDLALSRIGFPSVLKTTRFGYDGKGQAVLQSTHDVPLVWEKLGGLPLILEQFVRFQRELSILAVRGRTGEIVYYPLVENHHQEGILRRTLAPAPRWSVALQQRAEEYAHRALTELNYVGVLAIELFECDGELLVNEMAPRVHNSGHWTIEGAETSQFENHLRAVTGLPLGITNPRGCSVMWNLIGACPPSPQILAIPGAHLHDYGKSPRANRKVGHITITGCDANEVESRFQLLREVIELNTSTWVT